MKFLNSIAWNKRRRGTVGRIFARWNTSKSEFTSAKICQTQRSTTQRCKTFNQGSRAVNHWARKLYKAESFMCWMKYSIKYIYIFIRIERVLSCQLNYFSWFLFVFFFSSLRGVFWLIRIYVYKMYNEDNSFAGSGLKEKSGLFCKFIRCIVIYSLFILLFIFNFVFNAAVFLMTYTILNHNSCDDGFCSSIQRTLIFL